MCYQYCDVLILLRICSYATESHVIMVQWLNSGRLNKSPQCNLLELVWDFEHVSAIYPPVNNVWDLGGAIKEIWWDSSISQGSFLHPANERRRYFITTSLIGWAHASSSHSFMRLQTMRLRITLTSHERQCGPKYRHFDSLWTRLYAQTTKKKWNSLKGDQ